MQINFKVIFIRPEANRSNYEQADGKNWRAELVNVAKFWDDLWLGVKGQSRLVIAGSQRKIFKYVRFDYLFKVK